jgi:hypothetical protein
MGTMSRATGWLLMMALPSGCASTALGPERVSQVLAEAADQVKRCYRQPRMRSAGREISTRIRVRLARDGTLAGPPQLLWQSGVSADNRDYADRMAEAARLAVIRCAPLRLPPDAYADAWSEFDLTFSPSMRA